jgi:1,4-alpha-glucan branching enzyme
LEATGYLMLANELAHGINPEAITIAEDVSGMPGLARPVTEGGLGFDYRLAMGIPDYWIKLVKEREDENWSMEEMYAVLGNRRFGENHIGYAESHDQALVGDKTLAFRLMDQQMYWKMSKFAKDPVIDRGLALHKMIRLITFALGGEGYLNFMGNEFGHPEWIDFPRPGNNDSYHYARRQWSLVEREHLHFHELRDFDRAMLNLDTQFGLLTDPDTELLWMREDRKQLVFRRGRLVFAFNFHPTESYADFRIPSPEAADYRVVLDADAAIFGGFGLLAVPLTYPWQGVGMSGREQSLQIYLPARSAQVLAPVR